MNQCLPMLQIFHGLARSNAQSCPDGNWRWGTLVPFCMAHLAGEPRQLLKDVGREALVQLDQSCAYGLFECAFQARQNHAVEIRVVQLPQPERKDQLAPLVAYLEHLGDETFTVG